MTILRLDLGKLHSALDTTRQARRLSWRAVADASGVHPSLLTRMSHGGSPSAHGLVALVTWADLDLRDYVDGSGPGARTADPLAEALRVLDGASTLTDEGRRTLRAVVTAAYLQLAG